MNHNPLDKHAPQPVVTVLKVAHLAIKNNNYLVVDPVTRDALLIDPAWQPDTIGAALADAGGRLRGILLTHAHPDHVHLARPLSEQHRCPVWMSAREVAASGFQAERLIAFDAAPWQAGSLRVEPLPTPGHTPGCVCYRIGSHLFTGDVLFNEGCGICPDLDAAYAMYDSLELLKASVAPHTRIYPGHTYLAPPGLTFASVLERNLYLQFRDRESFAAYRLRPGQDPRKLFDFR
ncbi:MBL fold metallo-hydrolase [Paraburkholderia humisilvae]|uniref:Putative polyketide biosynthesis zinc-dependent hydrolase BaeB n=1 Tax=Paraburkholderia humisilvae TaxID=627669 RepID=A0A6J5ELB9_9BURK|nr:MBL fold metallo-hydrolase [Paraburkholderia humisilvae]CAB3765815.1 putative polyketide biosynthesis zinc-dependent hydrolase BaeB [Paraburkholderia humisilvae]